MKSEKLSEKAKEFFLLISAPQSHIQYVKSFPEIMLEMKVINTFTDSSSKMSTESDLVFLGTQTVSVMVPVASLILRNLIPDQFCFVNSSPGIMCNSYILRVTIWRIRHFPGGQTPFICLFVCLCVGLTHKTHRSAAQVTLD